MILFPNAKINLGLRILRRRPDGYHELVTAMIPIDWCDILEIVPSSCGQSSLSALGNALPDCPPEKNLVFKALRATETFVGRELPSEIYLYKNIPDGAGLGGGSSDAAFTIRGLNELYSLGLSDDDMAEIASGVGSDCPFFIYNRPMLATGTGTELRPCRVNLQRAAAILVAKGHTQAVSTREAYAGVTPRDIPRAAELLEDALLQRPDRWSQAGVVTNDFEQSIFRLRPGVEELKRRIENSGAIYTAMSGSGAAVFGLYATTEQAREAAELLKDCDTNITSTRSFAVV